MPSPAPSPPPEPGRSVRRESKPPALRVGSVPYLVGRPLDKGLGGEPGISLEHDVPARLIERLRSGDLDVALVSSIELFRGEGYRYLDGIGVAGDGYVGSVQVFLRTSIQDAERLAMDPASRAAAALTKSLLFERRGGPPEYVEVPLGEDPAAREDTDGWLRIGDQALRETLTLDTPAWNPSEEWRRRTGLPFVFAAWIVRGGVEIAPHLDAFRRARASGRLAVDELAHEAAAAWSLPAAKCRTYLAEECRYDPAEDMGPALREFQKRAARAGLCDPRANPQPIAL